MMNVYINILSYSIRRRTKEIQYNIVNLELVRYLDILFFSTRSESYFTKASI